MAKPKKQSTVQMSMFERGPERVESPAESAVESPVEPAETSGGGPGPDEDLGLWVLREVFGHAAYRPGQQRAVDALLHGRDAVVLLPTGGGKSSCFQVPAVVLARAGRGCTVVISPLLALMHDQVSGLRELGIRAEALNSNIERSEQSRVVRAFEAGELELLYVSPERAAQTRFRRSLARARVALLAIDEAHCVSQWGHDFRPEYMRLHELRAHVRCPLIALTATATLRVLDELITRLQLREPARIEGGFGRPNLSFEVHAAATDVARFATLNAALNGVKSGRVIIYCSTRKKTQRVCQVLCKAGHAAGYYHAGRTKLARERAEQAFRTGKRRVLVATNAFGMGVDFSDVRLLVHFQTPGSVEAYYQEAGRAGRDGLASRCILFYGASDLMTQRRLAIPKRSTAAQRARVEEAIEGIVAYAYTKRCRQQAMSEYFGSELAACGRCDCCRGEVVAPQPAPKPRARAVPVSVPAGLDTLILAALTGMPKPVGRLNLARALRGSKSKSVRTLGLHKHAWHGAVAEHSEAEVLAALDSLLAAKRLVLRGRKYPKLWLAGATLARKPSSKTKTKTKATPRSELAREITNYRRREARRLGCKPFMVFHRKVIPAVVRRRPQTLEELALVPGLGPVKVEQYGEALLELVREYT